MGHDKLQHNVFLSIFMILHLKPTYQIQTSILMSVNLKYASSLFYEI